MEQYTIADLKKLIQASRGQVKTVYLHWTAARYHQFFDDYHILIDNDGTIWLPDEDLTIKRSHTWRRNSDSVGIALCCCYGAIANAGYNADFGEFPVTDKQIETLAVITALFVKYGDVPLSEIYTHCEIAYYDNYGPFSGDPDTRWDLWYLPDSAYNGKMRNGGEVIRGKAMWYINNGDL